ncbi:sensor histidine kinase [Nocardiopsis tropica]|uniref:Histidine kinase n=1 Tax=Nocardiopsis tropica TaxID=109330 RepID=A0ABU7KIQ4_9ACTN|nr:histidine kinase [Nocardiopsis umidischolae]MEE2049170.1 histidine kinase [Nocardiopsis umidischolae]
MSEHADAARGELRTVNLGIVFASLSTVGALLVVIDAPTWWQALVLALGVATAAVTVTRWAEGRAPRLPLPALAVTGAVWLFGVLVAETPTASYGFAVVGTVVVHQAHRHRTAAVLGLAAFVAAVLAARLAVAPGEVVDTLLEYGVGSAGIAVVAVVLTSLTQMVSRLVAELEESREREAELAVARERMRFASDLHDIQGHTLHVVKLKTALARRLVRTDTGRAEEELGEIHALVGDTIAQTKALAHAQRRLNLSAELENAKNLFEAAGIRVEVRREGGVQARAGEMLGQVLRETTTNILRHAQAGQVWITLSGTGISIVNDGAQEGPPTGLSGLATLRERVAGEGGELTVERRDGRFLTAASFPSTAAGASSLPHRPAPTRKDDR